MNSHSLRTLTLKVGITLLTGMSLWIAASDKPNFVEIEGLNKTYSSCSVLPISIRNVSRQEIFARVYVEVLKSGSWENDDCPYDLRDPAHWLNKLILISPKMTRPGESFSLIYDRCSDFERCSGLAFGRHDARASRQALVRKDAKATPPVTERLRVEIFVRDPLNAGRVMRVAKEWSPSFTRSPRKESDVRQ